ncbi:MAG: carboxypeptidase-like regulatory domain-containing protein [Candidatus Acidiferrum sp.]
MRWDFIKRNLLISFAAILLAAVSAWGQTGTTSLRGTVLDKTGAAIVGATVTLDNAAQAVHHQAKTGPTGEYEFLALLPGTYSLTVEAAGFRKSEQKNMQLLVNTPATLNVTLEVGTTTETVEVSAQATTLNTTDASLGNAFNETQIKQLPMDARNVPDLLSLQAGVAYTGNRPDINLMTDTRSGAVNGARSDQSNITLDGVDVNSDTRGYAFTSVIPVTADSVEEFRVTTSNYNADEGRSSGAQVALVTKSGTNNFHGAIYEYLRNTITSANDYFVKLSQLESGQPNEAPKLIRNNFGGALGGPIWKDRLFFFANYEGERQAEQQSVVRVVPSAAMRDGVLTYLCQTNSDGSLNTAACPGGNVQGLTGAHNIQPGYFGLTPGQIQGMDPQGIGVSSNVMIPYLNSFPLPNDNSVGDGVNFQGYRFKGPAFIGNNWYIARVDYKITQNGNHTLYWRGGLENDVNDGVPYLPGGSPELTEVSYNKGFAAGYSAVLRPTLVNNFRWGFTRESFGEIGNQTQPVIFFRGLNDDSTPNNSSLAVTNSLNYQVPVQNFVDDVSWIRGKHTFSFGGNVNILRNPQSSNSNSFSSATTNASWFDTAALANTGVAGHFDPGCSVTAGACAGAAYPAVDSSFGNNYDYPLIAMVGMVDQVNAQYNFTRTGDTIAQGAPVLRHFADDAYEMYAQDSWKIKPNFTFTFGLRYSLFSPPWETNGNQVVSNVDLTNWFNNRGAGMLQGTPANAAPPISFNLGGPANNGPGFYNWDKKDLGPRVAFAWSPKASDGLFHSLFGDGKTTVRGGFGMVYDRIGPALLATFDASGSFGLSSNLTNGGGIETPATAPRITGLTGLSNIPTMDLAGNQMYASAPPGTFPQTFPSGNETGAYAVYWGMDQNLKTPYSYTIDLSVGRELWHDYTLEVAYVGRLSHRLLSQEDVAAPLDLVDPISHVDYYSAVQALAKLYRAGTPVNSITPATVGPTAQYWADILQASPDGYATPGFCGAPNTMTALQAAYNLFSCFSDNETTAVQFLDQGMGLFDPSSGNPIYAKGGPYSFVDPQFAALYAWRSIGAAAYNGLEVTLRKHLTHGLTFDLNYTYSHSLDISSDANRIGAEGGLGGQVINPWDPTALRGDSDFDLRHQINANWVAELPFGSGRRFAGAAHGFTEAVIGGWQLSGLARWTSGFPVGVSNGAEWPTNWQLSGNATQTGPVTTVGASKNPDGTVNIFGSTAAGATALGSYAPDMPGQVGARNTLRGDGFASLDLGLDKRWKMPWKESQSLQFRWEVFNALNLTRFDVQSLNLSITNAANFGTYTGLLTNPRTMQFALRYEF